MKRIIFVFLSFFISGAFASDDCIDYKLTPNITIKSPVWTKSVVQPLKKMDVLHGNVAATLIDEFEITADITSIEDGFCVALKNVDATIGYSDFLVQIDISHKPNTCSYNAILQHEDEHIRAYLSVIEDNKDLFAKSIKNAADSIVPVFIKNEKDIESAIDKLNNELQNHPDIVLLKQQIRTDEEIRNKYVDINDTGETLKRCFD
ncbi:MAG: hypothetical protein IKF41_03860 [Alphaproteobacteria bacterium]|nr:hypothetical protein [Alphaproteobacteria bacterium]